MATEVLHLKASHVHHCQVIIIVSGVKCGYQETEWPPAVTAPRPYPQQRWRPETSGACPHPRWPPRISDAGGGGRRRRDKGRETPVAPLLAGMEAVLNDLVAVEDLMKFEKKYLAELSSGSLSKGTQFEYAWCLIRSKYSDDIQKGAGLLEDLLPKGSKDEQRDYLFYLSVAHYRLKEYEKSLKYVRTLLQKEPKNTQAQELEKVIEKKMQKDGLVGMAIVGGIAVGVAGLAGLIGLAVAKSK